MASLCGLLFWLSNNAQLPLQIGGATVLFGGVEGIHGGSVVGMRQRTRMACGDS